ncbi:unnamed protein product [Periconia digitata]|uniref:Uncharacterized protein n=1 Tax=Periconia digitata TaxID=1303443 RepID=A0A9W4UAH7_9PLEO|nr:unnamed protein product [Periconia digitata]
MFKCLQGPLNVIRPQNRKSAVAESEWPDWSTPRPRAAKPWLLQLRLSTSNLCTSLNARRPTRSRNHDLYKATAFRQPGKDSHCHRKLSTVPIGAKMEPPPGGSTCTKVRNGWADHRVQSSRSPYQAYRSRFGPQYKIQPNFHGITSRHLFKYGSLAAGFGGVAGFFALFFFSEVPRVREDIMRKVPILGDYFVREIPPEDNPF